VTTLSTKRTATHSLLQSVLGGTRPSSQQGISRTGSPLSTTKQVYAPPAVIANAQQFHEYFGHLTSSLLHSQDSAYRAHLEEIKAYNDACAVVGEELERSEEFIDGMVGCLKWVEERGENLRVAGETLMQEEVSTRGNALWVV
jgi:hypothetical protein